MSYIPHSETLQPLTSFDVLHSYGFLKMISIIWIPLIIVLVCIYLNNRRKKKTTDN